MYMFRYSVYDTEMNFKHIPNETEEFVMKHLWKKRLALKLVESFSINPQNIILPMPFSEHFQRYFPYYLAYISCK